MPGLLLAWLVIINVVTAAMYARDKLAAKRPGARRVRERTLWLLCFAGGVVGAWLVFFGMRHKSRQGCCLVCALRTMSHSRERHPCSGRDGRLIGAQPLAHA